MTYNFKIFYYSMINGKKIKSKRVDAGLSRPQLAAMINVSTETIGRLERSKWNGDMVTTQSLAKTLGIQPHEIDDRFDKPTVQTIVEKEFTMPHADGYSDYNTIRDHISILLNHLEPDDLKKICYRFRYS